MPLNTIIILSSIFGTIVTWIVAVYGAIFRKDLKHANELWMMLILIVPFAHCVYFFMENKKVWGYVSVGFYVLLVASIVSDMLFLFK